MERKLKKIKEFIKDGPAQFDVLNRGKEGGEISIEVRDGGFESLKNITYAETIRPLSPHNTLIKKVRRIIDSSIFELSDSVLINNINYTIINFSENFIHCSVVSIESKKPVKIEFQINDIKINEEQHEIFEGWDKNELPPGSYDEGEFTFDAGN